MLVRLVSDLHLEHGNHPTFELMGEDVVVAAGDIANAKYAAMELRRMFPYQEVVYVAGNHEYYGQDFDKAHQVLVDTCKDEGIHFLENQTVTLNGQRFVGATHWTHAPLTARFGIADFNVITNGHRLFTVDDARALNAATEAYFDATIEEDDVVVTHFLPNHACVHPRYADSTLNDYFANNYPVVNKMWLHGHTHDKVDLPHIKCFPLGYPGEHGVNNRAMEYQGLFLEI